MLRSLEGYASAKLKVGHLPLSDAKALIDELKDQFHLRIDVNRAWSTKDALDFFSHYSFDAFDYVEEPFQNPKDLPLFTHPLAIDESFPQDLTLDEIASFPTLKALIYKPTLQGGMKEALPLLEWTKARGISFVLGSSFESDLGHLNIAQMAHRLCVSTPLGIGTYHLIEKSARTFPIRFDGPKLIINPIF